MAKKIIRRQLNNLVNRMNKESGMEHDHVLEAAEKRINVIREAIKEAETMNNDLGKRISSTEGRLCAVRRLENALNGANFIFNSEGDTFYVGGKEVYVEENGYLFEGEIYRKAFDIVKEINIMVRKGIVPPVEKEKVMEKEMKEIEMSERLELIKKRHQLMLNGLEEFDEDENEEFLASCNKVGDEDLEEMDDEVVDAMLGINAPPAHRDLGFKSFRINLEPLEITEGLREQAMRKGINPVLFENGNDLIREMDRVDKKREFIEGATESFIGSLRSSKDLACQWFPELGDYEDSDIDTFLKSCVGGEWNEQHADRVVHNYKVNLSL